MKHVYPKFVAPSIAAEVYGVTLQTLRRWAKAGKIDFIMTPGGQYRYNLERSVGVKPAVVEVAKPKKQVKPAKVVVAPTAPSQHQAKSPVVAAVPALAPAPKHQASTKPAPGARTLTPPPMLDKAALKAQIEALAAGA